MSLKETLILRAFGLMKIPTLFLVSPSVLKISKEMCEVKIPLNYITKNHLNSMYFGVLAMGADCAGGLMGMEAIKRSGKKVDLIFKDFKAEFLKRATSDVHFICKDGKKIYEQVQETIKSKKRTNRVMHIIATTPKVSGDEPIAKFELTLSLKMRE
ncbi:MAG: DUF4442 domain-containing protein [Deltaproteobacteria bacterium]|nr:DUF4442 domain-containing protein [Deltaproteobacteria bacterium]